MNPQQQFYIGIVGGLVVLDTCVVNLQKVLYFYSWCDLGNRLRTNGFRNTRAIVFVCEWALWGLISGMESERRAICLSYFWFVHLSFSNGCKRGINVLQWCMHSIHPTGKFLNLQVSQSFCRNTRISFVFLFIHNNRRLYSNKCGKDLEILDTYLLSLLRKLLSFFLMSWTIFWSCLENRIWLH